MDFESYKEFKKEVLKYWGKKDDGYPELPDSPSELYAPATDSKSAKPHAPRQMISTAEFYSLLKSSWERTIVVLTTVEGMVSTINAAASNLKEHVRRAEDLAAAAAKAVGQPPLPALSDQTRVQAAQRVHTYQVRGDSLIKELRGTLTEGGALEAAAKELALTFEMPSAKGAPKLMAVDDSVKLGAEKVQALQG